MKKIIKRTLLALGIILALLLIVALGFYFKFKSETKGMTPIATKEVVKNVFAINDKFVNMFLIKDSTQFIAIDAGNDADNISAELKKLNINPDKVIAVMLTHTDRDHVAGLKLFKNAKVVFFEARRTNDKRAKVEIHHEQSYFHHRLYLA